MAARVRYQVGHVGFVVEKVALRQVFFEHFGFPCQFSFHRLPHTHHHHHHHHLLSGAGTIRHIVADVPSGLNKLKGEGIALVIKATLSWEAVWRGSTFPSR
jgi:hypothetical protein